jgi:hypothetical protein
VRRKLTELLRQVDQEIPFAEESWTVERYLTYWPSAAVKRQRRPKTYQGYEGVVRLHLVPALGKKRLAKLNTRDVRTFLNRLSEECQCCKQGWDRNRGNCCTVRKCCGRKPSARSVQFVHAVLRNVRLGKLDR